jgi:uncharacterized protein (DUF934 family)
MRLIDYSNAQPAIDSDVWTHVADGAPLPPDRPATVSLERWKASREGLAGRNQPLGVRLDSHERIEEILPDLPRFALIALDFPNLNDGRHFSTARLLRERHGYDGRLRATGQVLRDQLDPMRRCGFDEFEMPAGKDAASAIPAFDEISVTYQPAADTRPTAAQLRHRPPKRAIAV